MRKSLIIYTMLVSLLAPLLACLTTAVYASQLPDYPFIHAVGNAKVYVQPDIGEINFEVIVSDGDSEKATEHSSAINDDILKLLAEQGIPAADITIYAVEKKMRVIDNPDGKPAASCADSAGIAAANATPAASATMSATASSSTCAHATNNLVYEIKQGMQIEVRDLSKWEGLTTPLLSKEHLGNFDTAFDRTDRQQIKDNLMQDAIKNAQHNGTLLAEGFGKHLGAVVAISTGKLHDIGFALGLAKGDKFDDDERRSTAIRNFSAPQALMIMQSVDVLFKIK